MVKVTVCGAAGGIGQPLSLLLKLDSNITELALFDIANAKGVAADLSHINTISSVKGYQPSSKTDTTAIQQALTGSQVVIIPAGVPRKPGMTRADLFKINAGIIRDLVSNVARYCPNACLLIISNPVNATVPIAAEVLKKFGVFNAKKLFGVTTLDSVRAETFLGDLIKQDPSNLKGEITVIGGHSGDTIVPLVNINSAISSKVSNLSKETIKKYVHRVQFGGDEVVQAKNGAGSATLSMAYAGYRFAEYIINSINNKPSTNSNKLPDSAFIYLPDLPNGKQLASALKVDYFSLPVILENGQIKEFINVLPKANSDEKKLIEIAIEGLQKSIVQGTNFVVGTKL